MTGRDSGFLLPIVKDAQAQRGSQVAGACTQVSPLVSHSVFTPTSETWHSAYSTNTGGLSYAADTEAIK